MKRFAGLATLLALASLPTASCSGGEGASTGGATDETPEPTPTPVASDPEPTPTPTQQSNEIRFVAIGDTGEGNMQQYQIAGSINAKCLEDGCDFGMLLGDNFYDSGVESPTDPQFVSKFEQPYGGLPFPLYIVLGNHDYGGDGAGYEFDKGAHQVAYSASNPQFYLPAEYYAVEEESTLFLGLGTNLIFWDHASTDAQVDYFSTLLDGSNHKWRIAFGHHPYLSNGKHGNAGEYDGVPDWIPIAHGQHVKDFFDETLCGRIDLYLAGHDHSRQILPGTAECPMTFVVSGAGAKTTDLPGDNPSHFQADTEGFAYVVVSDEKIVIQMLDMEGNLEFEHTILPN